MPEGPTIVILKEEVQKFSGKEILKVSGNSKIEQSRLQQLKVESFQSWGKHFLICFRDFTVRIHFLLFGSYRIDERKPDTVPRLSFMFDNGELNFYSCSVKILEGNIQTHYDWSTDVMSDFWNPEEAKRKLLLHPEAMVCDALLEQDIFSGVGNIIKNEVLYRIKVHPESIIGKFPEEKLDEVVTESITYSFQFLEWKKRYELKKHWLAHTKKWCLRCDCEIKRKQTGKKNRRSFICMNCQILYA